MARDVEDLPQPKGIEEKLRVSCVGCCATDGERRPPALFG